MKKPLFFILLITVAYGQTDSLKFNLMNCKPLPYINNTNLYNSFQKQVLTFDHDLRINAGNFRVYGSFGRPITYTQIPYTQIHPIELFGAVRNDGLIDEHNTILSASINSSGDVFYGQSLTSTIQAYGGVDTMIITDQYTPSATVGTRIVDFTVNSDSVDQNPTNNTVSESLEITNYIYARDHNNPYGTMSNNGYGYEIGNIFDVFQQQYACGIKFNVGSLSDTSAYIYGILYEYDSTGWFNQVNMTFDRQLTANDINNQPEVFLKFISSTLLDSGKTYLITAGSYGSYGTTPDLIVSTSGNADPYTSFFLDIDGNYGTPYQWYYLQEIPMVKLVMEGSTDCYTEIEENMMSLGLEQNMPNPASGTTLINYTVDNTTDINFQVVDMTGKIVYTSYEGTRTPGTYTINFNTAGLSSGMYFYSISNGTSKVTKLMSVAR